MKKEVEILAVCRILFVDDILGCKEHTQVPQLQGNDKRRPVPHNTST
jgi:hypothetical protein